MTQVTLISVDVIFFSFIVRDVVIVGPPHPTVQQGNTQTGDAASTAQMEATLGESIYTLMSIFKIYFTAFMAKHIESLKPLLVIITKQYCSV